MSKYLLLAYLAVSVLAFALFAYDFKMKSKHRYQARIPEADLLLVSIFGGSFGTLIGMITFQHKKHRKRFTIGVPLMLLVHAVLLVLVKLKLG